MAAKNNKTHATRINGVRVQSSVYGQPIPWGMGTNRVSGTGIYFGDFNAVEVKSKQSTGGKGGGGKNTNYTYNYYATTMIAIGMGPIVAVPSVYRGSSTFTTGATSAMAQAGLTLFTGAPGQSTWSYMTGAHPTEALSYSGLAYAAASNYALDGQAGLENHTFEVKWQGVDAASGGYDANGADVVTNFMTLVPGWPSGAIGDLTNYQTYCRAQNLFVSPLLDAQTQAGQFLADLLTSTNSEAIWSDGKLQIVPYGDTEVTANGYTFLPDITPVYDLTDDDFVVTDPSNAPITVEISDKADAPNITQVQFNDRAHQYNTNTVSGRLDADIDVYGERTDQSPLNLSMVCDATVAQVIANLRVQRLCYIRDTFTFSLPWNFDRLNVMDVVTLTDEGLGLDRSLVRITAIEEGDDFTRNFTAEPILVGTAHAPLYTTQGVGGYRPNYEASPGNVSVPVLFNPPSSLTNGQLEVWGAVAGLSPNWGGAMVYTSLDGTTYSLAGKVTGSSRYGSTTALYPISADPDTFSPGFDFDFVNGTYLVNGTSYANWAAVLSGSAATFTRSTSKNAENTSNVYSSFAVNTAAITDKGLLIEPAETQYLAYTGANTNFTPAGSANGLTHSITGTGTASNGLPYVEITTTGTTTNTSSYGYYFDSLTAITAAVGDIWTAEAWVDIISNVGVTNVSLSMTERGTTTGTTLVPMTSGVRTKATRTFVNTGAANAAAGVVVVYTNGAVVNSVIRVYGFNLMKYSVATFTSPLTNTSGTRPSTRAADVLTIFPPSGTYNITATFDDNSTQTLTGQVITGSGWTVPTTLNRSFIKRIKTTATHSLAVDLSVSNGTLTSSTTAGADSGLTLSWLGGELISYSTATLTSANHYTLDSYVRRGQNSTSIVSHSSGAKFVRLDDSIYKYPFLKQQIGQTLYVKFASFNIFGKAQQNLADVTAYSIVLSDSSTPPSSVQGLALQSVFNTTRFSAIWAPSANATSYKINLYKSDGVTLLRSVTSYSTSFSYTQQDAWNDGYLKRSFVLEVIASNSAGDSASTRLNIANTAPAVISGAAASGTGTSRTITWTANTEVDFAGYMVYYSVTSGFDPTTGGGTLAYNGVSNTADIQSLTPGVTYYVRVAAYDSWTNDPSTLVFCPQISFTA